MKKYLAIIICCLMVAALVGCAEDDHGQQWSSGDLEDADSSRYGVPAMVELGDGLWYDSNTLIVYWWNGWTVQNCATTPSPYYAPNGLPYRYNPETNTFEEIE